MRFKHYSDYPPGGVYFYELDGKSVESSSRPEICLLVKALHRDAGLPVPWNPFERVMAHMCKSMPPGFCDGLLAGSASMVRLDEVKTNTRKLFGVRPAPPVVVRERLHVCLSCPENTKSACPSCSGLLDWVLKGMGSRTRIPADDFAFVCRPARTFVSALVSAEDPGQPPDNCPEGCWRLHGRKK